MSARPRIDLLTTGLDIGGAEHQLILLAAALQRRGWPVRIISMIPAGALSATVLDAGIQLLDLGMARGRADPRAVVRLGRALRQRRSDVLLSFMYHANVLGRLSGRLVRVPLVVSSMRNERFGADRRESVLRRTDWMGDLNVVNSERAADSIRARNLVPRRGIVVIPNALDATRYTRCDDARVSVRSALGVAADTFVWLMIARLDPQKDHRTAIQAFSALSDANARLVIAGDGPLAESLRVTAGECGVADRVTFLGIRSDVPALLAAADALVLSSAWEGLPNVIMEALATRVPVVATDVGGVRELVRDGETGILVPPGAPSALACGMRRLRELAPPERARLGEAGYQLVHSGFGIEHVTDRWEALLLRGQA